MTARGLWRENFGDVGAVLKRLELQKITTHDLARLQSDDRQTHIVSQALKAGRDHKMLRPDIISLEPFGPAVFGAEDWLRLYDLAPDCYTQTRFPWSPEVLNGPCPFYLGKTVAETHFAFQGSPLYRQILTDTEPVPLTIRQWMKLHPHSDQSRRRFWQNRIEGFETESFMTAVVEPRWYLMLRNPVPGSKGLSYSQQSDLLPAEYEVPSAVELATLMILAIEKSRILCCPNQFGRVCDTVGSQMVKLDLHSQDMLPGWIGFYPDDGEAQEGTGITASRLLPRYVNKRPTEDQPASARVLELINVLPESGDIEMGRLMQLLQGQIGMEDDEFSKALQFALANDLARFRIKRGSVVLLWLGSAGQAFRKMR